MFALSSPTFHSCPSFRLLFGKQLFPKIHYFTARYFLHISTGHFFHIYSHFTVRKDNKNGKKTKGKKPQPKPYIGFLYFFRM